MYGTVDIPALNETYIELSTRLLVSESWVATDSERIIGAVSLRTHRDAHEVERLMVAPDRRGEGVSTRLLAALEQAAIDAGLNSLRLTVGDLALDNQRIYEHLGWHRIRSIHPPEYDNVLLHIMAKDLVGSNQPIV